MNKIKVGDFVRFNSTIDGHHKEGEFARVVAYSGKLLGKHRDGIRDKGGDYWVEGNEKHETRCAGKLDGHTATLYGPQIGDTVETPTFTGGSAKIGDIVTIGEAVHFGLKSGQVADRDGDYWTDTGCCIGKPGINLIPTNKQAKGPATREVPMAKFNIGDRVILNDEGYHRYNKCYRNPPNTPGTIIERDPDGCIAPEGWIIVQWDNGKWNDYEPDALGLVTEKAAEEDLGCGFKVGERVKCKDGESWEGYGYGVIEKMTDTPGNCGITVKLDSDSTRHKRLVLYPHMIEKAVLTEAPAPKRTFAPLTPEQEAILLLAKKHGLRLRRG